LLCCLALCMASAGLGGLARAADETVNALLLTTSFEKPAPELEERLAAQSIRLVSAKLSAPLSREYLRLFHVVVIPDFEGAQTPFFVPTDFVVRYFDTLRNLDTVREYVSEGGGLLVSPCMNGAGAEVAEAVAALLEPLGAGIMAAQVRDDANNNAAADGGKGATYAWTTRIENHPAAGGAVRLWYPINMLRWDDAYACVPLTLADRAWQAVVRGMPGSFAAQGLQYATWIPVAGVREPVIAAVRECGRGRIALWGISPFYTCWAPYAEPPNGWLGESCTGPVAGIFLEKGQKGEPSDGLKMMTGTLRWLAEISRKAGMGGYDPERAAAMRQPQASALPAWLGEWKEDNGARPIRVLVGARSSFSDGIGSVAEHAAAARRAGYGVLVMTETFEAMAPSNWPSFCAACRAASDSEMIVLPGVDIADAWQNRFLIFGSTVYPADFMLTPDRRALAQPQYLSLGFGTHFTAIHRPSTTPMPHHLHKFFSGVSVFTYRDGRLVDNGLPAYEWHVNNEGVPVPLVVHEIRDPAMIGVVATSGVHQLYVFADTVRNAAWYLRAGMQHFWETPSKFLVSAGPMVRSLRWGRVVADGAALHSGVPADGGLVVESPVPIERIELFSHGFAERRWRPNAPRAEVTWHLPFSHDRWAFLAITDSSGRTAVTPAIRGGPAARYSWRCSDRQNFFGFAAQYTGTILPDIDIHLPAPLTDEGRGFWPHPRDTLRGENLAPMLEFPYTSPAVSITDAFVDQRYSEARWEDVAFDAKAAHPVSRSRVYEARARYLDFNISEDYRQKDPERPLIIRRISIRLRRPVEPAGPVFPVFTAVSPKPEFGYWDAALGYFITGRIEKGWADIPAGGYADDLVALGPALRVDERGQVGFAAPARGGIPFPAGHEWSAEYVKIPRGKMGEFAEAMGLTGKPPYDLRLSQGRILSAFFALKTRAEDWGIRGDVRPAQSMPWTLPLLIEGMNPYWPAAVIRDGSMVEFGVFEGTGFARLDATRPGWFYAGHIATADDPAVRLSIVSWDADRIEIEANNASDVEVETELATPRGIPGRYHLQEKIKLAAGECRRFVFPSGS